MRRKVVVLVFLCFGINAVYARDRLVLRNSIVLERATFDDLYRWEEEDFGLALNALLETCPVMEKLSLDKDIFPQVRTNQKITKNDFYVVCKVADIIRSYNIKYKQTFFESFFIPYKVVKKKGERTLFTGYYIPMIRAKTKKDNVFKYPIYKRPEDLGTNKYYTREQINDGILQNRNLEIFYTDDPVDLFFAHIQGSMNVFLVDESRIVALGFDGKNNHKFSSIGKFMVENNLISSSDLNSVQLKKELKKRSHLFCLDIFNVNASYIFFRLLEENGITGAFGMRLIPMRTIAVDRDTIPLGFPLWLNTYHTMRDGRREFNKLVIANDTGSAIKGSVRGDIFFGYGNFGEEQAGYQYSEGEYYLLIPEKIVRKL
ncbi:MAG: MltA domain-containing protein [Rickettsiales bacterium]|jgi:membrane-bound lytic murein transglycosylase A|nr:MltA domain-containing protein [Rickettsiales bacterium]